MGDGQDEKLAQGEAYERAGNIAAARATFAQLARTGHTGALFALARSLLVHQPLDIPNGIGMLKSAADKGDPDAAQLCAVLAAQDESLEGRWSVAIDYLLRAARQGSERARRQLALLAGA